jgi:hypothetical protein
LSIRVYPEAHLEVLQKKVALYFYLGRDKIPELLKEGNAKLENFLQKSGISSERKIVLERKFFEFKHLEVYALAQQDPAKALELADVHKNLCLSRLREGWDHKPPQPTYADIETLLKPQTAIIYWHFSPVALTTFILKPGQSPRILPLDQQQYKTAAHHLQRFEDWMQQWKKDYRSYRDLPPQTKPLPPGETAWSIDSSPNCEKS